MRRLRLFPTALLVLTAPLSAQTSYTWVGGSGSWFTPSNWSPNGVPGIPDTAIVTSGSLELVRDTTVARFEFGGSSFDGNGHLTVTTAMEWTDGRMNGRGFAETAALTIASGATLRISGQTDKGLRGRDIFNEGTILWEGTGNLDVQWPAKLENRAGAAFYIRNDAQITRSNGTLELINSGTLAKSAGTGAASLSFPSGRFENNGTVRADVGTLALSNGTTGFSSAGNGTFEIADGAVLRFNSDYSFDPGSTVTGAGTLLLTAGTTRLSRVVVTGPTIVAGGALRLTDSNTPSELATLNLSAGGIGGEAEINVNGLATWTGGGLGIAPFNTGILNLLGGIEASGPDAKRFISGTFVNSGLFRWMEGPLRVQDMGTFLNLSGATFAIESDEQWTRDNGSLTVVNEGTIVKSGTAGQTTISLPLAPFNNDGEVRVESGTLHLNITASGGNSTDTGRYQVLDGAALIFSGSTRTFTADASIVGTGTVAFNGTTRFGGTIRPGASPGVLMVSGDWPAMQPTGVLDIEIGGLAPGTGFDQLDVSGAAILGGILRVTLTDGFTPGIGERFQIIPAAGGATGSFDQIELPTGLEAYVAVSASGAELVVGTPIAIEPEETRPDELALLPPAPNPSRGSARLTVDLPASAHIRVSVYDALGREVAVLVDADRPAGHHSIGLTNLELAPGPYVVRMLTSGETRTERFTVVR